MSGSERLYTPEMLGAAVELAGYPLGGAEQFRGEARAPSCGSSLILTLDLDKRGAVSAIGLQARACAVGQASAAIFARHVKELAQEDIARAETKIHHWLSAESGDGAQVAALPDWPDLSLIAAAKDYPGRHGAIMLPWKAALSALSKTASPS